MIPFIVEGIDIIYIKLGNLISCLLLREGKGREGMDGYLAWPKKIIMLNS